MYTNSELSLHKSKTILKLKKLFKKQKHEQSLNGSWDSAKHSTLWITGVTKGKEREWNGKSI